MALMIPSQIPQDTLSRAETELFKGLSEQLDDSHIVFHSFCQLLAEKGKKPRQLETDFLILRKDVGFVALEAKAGHLSFRADQDRWYQNGKPSKDPVKQARNCQYGILHLLKEQFGTETIPLTYGHAVAFPDEQAAHPRIPPNLSRDIVLNSDDCRNLGKSVNRIFEFWRQMGSGTRDPEFYKKVETFLTGQYEFGAMYSNRIEMFNERIEHLTNEQCTLLDFIADHTEARIEGCAGSGKTVMAVKKARQLAAGGKKVLLLCYNILLGEKLFEAVRGCEGTIVARPFLEYCRELLHRGGVKINYDGDDHYYNVELPQQTYDLLGENPVKYDAVIVDEGQDFRDEYWVVVDSLRKENSVFYVFYDPAQNLYNPDEIPQIPISLKPYRLTRNCRNTKEIYKLLKPLNPGTMESGSNTPEGMEVIRHRCSSGEQVCSAVQSVLDDFIRTHGLTEEQIVILGSRRLEHTSIATAESIGRYTVSQNGEESGDNIIPYYTYKKFKGCESDAVILIDVNPEVSGWDSIRGLYTAISRAKALLCVVYMGQEC